MLGILGSGFGLYGYLPAAVSLGLSPILLPTRYQRKLQTRQELIKFSKYISWFDSDEALFKTATTLVVCRRPMDQFKNLPLYLVQPQLKKIVLEKPLATNPSQALQMLQSIKELGKQCTAGFTFRFSPWAVQLHKQLFDSVNRSQEIWHLKWHFFAHHFLTEQPSWKRNHLEGGGALRFYGIHFIALLAEWGYCQVVSSEITQTPDQGYVYWRATLWGPNLPKFKIDLNTRSSNTCFILHMENQATTFYEGIGPFDNSIGKSLEAKLDPRCGYLQEVLSEVALPNVAWPLRLFDAIKLWALIESKTLIE
jgi:hypothetical protein